MYLSIWLWFSFASLLLESVNGDRKNGVKLIHFLENNSCLPVDPSPGQQPR